MGSIRIGCETYAWQMPGESYKGIGYTPDVGHIAKVDMDPLSIIKQYRELVNLVHYKDIGADGQWVQTGEGIIEFNQITKYLLDTNYIGWIIMEDECDQAIDDPDGYFGG